MLFVGDQRMRYEPIETVLMTCPIPNPSVSEDFSITLNCQDIKPSSELPKQAEVPGTSHLRKIRLGADFEERYFSLQAKAEIWDFRTECDLLLLYGRV